MFIFVKANVSQTYLATHDLDKNISMYVDVQARKPMIFIE